MKREVNYTLIRSNRKTIAIHITKEAKVEVRAPFKSKQSDIDYFIILKKDWIEKQLKKIGEAQENRQSFKLNYGDRLGLMGRNITIAERIGDKVGFDGQHFYLPPRFPPVEIKRAVIGLYKQIARQVLTDRTFAYAKETGLMPVTIKVNSAKTRWGSCSSKGSINYSWRLIMAEVEVIDYVIVHELAHIKELNHSSKFWEIVASIMPDYKLRQKKLKEFQKMISHEDWE